MRAFNNAAKKTDFVIAKRHRRDLHQRAAGGRGQGAAAQDVNSYITPEKCPPSVLWPRAAAHTWGRKATHAPEASVKGGGVRQLGKGGVEECLTVATCDR